MDNKLIGLGVFIAAYIAARMINERALRNLEEEDAGRLLGGFSAYRIYSLVGVAILVILYFALNLAMPGNRFTSTPVFVGALVFYLVVSSIIAYRKLKRMNMPDQYVNWFLVSTLIQYLGIFTFFAVLLSVES